MYNIRGGDSGITENRLMRLAFHDCVRYTGCKGLCAIVNNVLLTDLTLYKMDLGAVMVVSTGKE